MLSVSESRASVERGVTGTSPSNLSTNHATLTREEKKKAHSSARVFMMMMLFRQHDMCFSSAKIYGRSQTRLKEGDFKTRDSSLVTAKSAT